MKRRNFLKGVLGVGAVAAAPKILSQIEEPKLYMFGESTTEMYGEIDTFKRTGGNKLLTSEEVTREAFRILEINLKKL